jgi:hypothetical protein
LGGEDEPETKEDLQDLGNLLAAERPKKGIDYDLVGLGGLIMGARNMSEFGKGLSDFAQTSANRKIEREFKEAQMAKLRADVKAQSFNEIQAEIQSINKGFETGALNMEDPVIQNYLMSLYQALAKRRGGTLQDDILKQQQVS